ncbi:hypothetical protein [Pontibacter anaerobius]|uniref:Uncharacterized protein n=1 Tax=Pontibacter anaerobius TaxID=2993940 RepID=A0ABT3RIH8_9BACT|nr:hypothetical protein [Pontibacter anaerobius]MCX2741303.1 hypothetical protein [Pontibacter anaerobius]
MKRTYAFILAGSMLAATSLTSCGTENTTGVETETETTDVDGMENEDMNNGTMMDESVSDTTMEGTAGDTMSTTGN